MIPAMKLNVRPVTTSQPPQSTKRGPGPIGARQPARASTQPATSRTSAAGSSHDDLAADLRVEQPRIQPVSPPARRPAAAADAAGLVAGEPAEAVVAEGQLQHAVVLRAADVRPRATRPQLDDRAPTSRRDQHRHAGEQQVARSAATSRGRGEQVHQRERGQRRGTPAASSRGSRSRRARRPARASGCRLRRLDRPRAVRVRRADQQQHEQRVGVVEAEHQHRDRGQRQHRAGDQPGAGPGDPLDRRVQQPDGRRRPSAPAGTRMLQCSARRCAPTAHDPQRRGRLVDGDRVRGVGGAEEPRLPALRAGLGGGGVEGVGPAGARQPPQVEHGGGGEQRGQREAGPPRAPAGPEMRARRRPVERGAWARSWSRCRRSRRRLCRPGVPPVRHL